MFAVIYENYYMLSNVSCVSVISVLNLNYFEYLV